MLLTRKWDAQYQQYNKFIHMIFMEDMPLLLPPFETSERHQKGFFSFVLKTVIGISKEEC